MYPYNKSQGISNFLKTKTKQSILLNYIKLSSVSLNHKRYLRIIQLN
jgi:hypothetical protein